MDINFFLHLDGIECCSGNLQKKIQPKTCSKGFEQKVATLRLKTPLKMKDSQ